MPALLFSQTDTTDRAHDEIIFGGICEVMPSFPRGDEARMKFIASNIKYTKRALDDSVSGVVYINFIVDEIGSIKSPKILRGIHPDLDSIAIDLIKRMPHWIPAENRGENIACPFNMPIRFNAFDQKEVNMPKTSKYWQHKGKRQFMKRCTRDFDKSKPECKCWHNFIIWNYNELRLEDLDLPDIFTKQKCKY